MIMLLVRVNLGVKQACQECYLDTRGKKHIGWKSIMLFLKYIPLNLDRKLDGMIFFLKKILRMKGWKLERKQ